MAPLDAERWKEDGMGGGEEPLPLLLLVMVLHGLPFAPPAAAPAQELPRV